MSNRYFSLYAEDLSKIAINNRRKTMINIQALNVTLINDSDKLSEIAARLSHEFGEGDFTLRKCYSVIFTDDWMIKSHTERQNRGRLFSKTEEYKRFGLRISRKCSDSGVAQTYCIN